LNSSGKERGGSFLFSKACKSLYRRRFKEIEDAPFAANILTYNQYLLVTQLPLGTPNED